MDVTDTFMIELFEETVKAEKFSWKRLGSLPLTLALSSCDIGICKIPITGQVYITWGRNLTRVQQKWFCENTNFKPVWVGADDGTAELILPGKDVEKFYLKNLVMRTGSFIDVLTPSHKPSKKSVEVASVDPDLKD